MEALTFSFMSLFIFNDFKGPCRRGSDENVRQSKCLWSAPRKHCGFNLKATMRCWNSGLPRDRTAVQIKLAAQGWRKAYALSS